jgi:hypothetical protein
MLCLFCNILLDVLCLVIHERLMFIVCHIDGYLRYTNSAQSLRHRQHHLIRTVFATIVSTLLLCVNYKMTFYINLVASRCFRQEFIDVAEGWKKMQNTSDD